MVVAIFIIVVILVVAVKVNIMRQTRCIHCGHDNGITGFQAAVCPACGLNKTIISGRKARKR